MNPGSFVSNTGQTINPGANTEAAGGGRFGFVGADGGESVIGTDGRSQVTTTTSYPSRAIVHVTRNNSSTQGHCTAEFIGPDTLLTAGHCLHSGGSSGSFYSGLRFYPARNGSSTPYGYCVARPGGLYVLTGWKNYKQEAHDLGVVKLSCKTGNSTGWFGWYWQSASQKGYSATVRGYPGDKPYATMWTMNGTLAESQTYQNFYSIDTFGGQSGSPVFQYRYNQPYCNGYCIHTNHSYGVQSSLPYPHNSFNHGRRIDQTASNGMAQIRAMA